MYFSYKNREQLAAQMSDKISNKEIDNLEQLWENEFSRGSIGFSGKRVIQLLRKSEYQWALSILFSESDKIPYPEESLVWQWFVNLSS